LVVIAHLRDRVLHDRREALSRRMSSIRKTWTTAGSIACALDPASKNRLGGRCGRSAVARRLPVNEDLQLNLLAGELSILSDGAAVPDHPAGATA